MVHRQRSSGTETLRSRLATALLGVVLLSACSSGGIENGRWWLERGSVVGPASTELTLRVGFVGCSDSEVTIDQIVGQTVMYTETEVIIAIQVDRPRHSGVCGGAHASGQPIHTITLEEPMGNRQLLRQVGDLPPSPAYEYNY